ncbi:MAG: hybrid sensor histidine kinase/response regulator [Rhodospirillaceae bacterium]|nr:MAG: hybrid sensor histidine kinase/response regulator [Rhodospirillaceae bacterium]
MTRILVVEDSPTQAETLRSILDSAGFSVDVATDAETALEAFDRAAFDIVISDIVMPGMSGYELCRKIKSNPKSRATPVILLTSLSDPMDIIRGLECEADNFITKPYQADQLLSRIRSIIENRKARTDSGIRLGIELVFLDKRFVITSEKEQILDLLISTFEDTIRANIGLRESQEQLAAANAKLESYARELESRVQERTLELEQKAAQLRHAERLDAIGSLTGGIAHDFNNLLTVVKSSVEYLCGELTDPPLWQAADMAQEAANRGADLVRHLLTFARKQELSPKVLDVNALVESVVKLARRTLPSNIAFIVQMADNLPPVHIDPGQMENAILNLAVNARDAMPNGGEIIVETRTAELDEDYARENVGLQPGSYVLIALSDTGIGMSQDVINRAFEPFFTTKEPGKGTGLGLSSVYGLIKQSGGHAKIYSVLGKGTTIKIYLPVVAEVQASIKVPHQKTTATIVGSGTILLVEDDELVRKSVTSKLKRLGYDVTAVASAAEAITTLEDRANFKLMLSDVMMPGTMTGADLAREVMQRWPRIGVLLSSGYTESSIGGKVRLPSDVRLLSKPYSNADLAQALAETESRQGR